MLQKHVKKLKFHAKNVVMTSNRHVVTKLNERKAMGLAASQARFLAITARKMNCEFQSMQIAQEKLSVTRDLQKAAQDYQNSLSATKLVWDTDDKCDGSGDIYDLSYNVMMTPSTLNEFDPYLITDTLGRVLLSDAMYNAAVDAGLIYANGSPKGKLDAAGNGTAQVFKGAADAVNDGSRNAFLHQLGAYNQIDGAMADAIYALGDSGYTRSGIGGKIYDKSTSNALQTPQFIKYMQKMTYGEACEVQGLKLPEGKNRNDKIYAMDLFTTEKDKDGKEYPEGTIKVSDTLTLSLKTSSLDVATKKDGSGNDVNSNTYMVTNNGRIVGKDELKNVTIGDLLSGKYEITFNLGSGNYKDVQHKLIQAIASPLGLGAGESEFKGLNVDNESDAALSQAYSFTTLVDGSISAGSDTPSDLYLKARNQNNVVKSNSGNMYSFSLSNLAKSYLTNYAIGLEGWGSGYSVEDTVSLSKYITDDPSYYFLLKNDAALTDRTMLNADFYNMLYNQIVTNGAISDSNLRELYTTDMDMLQNAIKNGNLFISSLHNDGYYYQGPYTASGHVAEIPDDDAIARAELEYTLSKAKLNTKEESLEIQMKNLDMEISSLTTEFDTVKNLISKNVEKIFTMFST